MLVLSNEEIEQMLTMPECMVVLREMYCDLAEGQLLVMPRVDNLAPASTPGAYYAFKHMGGIWPRKQVMALRINSDVITHPVVGNSIRRVKVPAANGRWVGLVQLYNTETGELLAHYPDGVVQRMRVGAASGIAVDALARRDARRAGMIGSGWQAGSQLMALLAARPIEELKVYSIRKASREAFVAEWRARTGANIRAVDTADEAARDVDILLSATSSLVPTIQPEWLKPGMCVACIKVHEVNQAVINACDRIGVHNKQQVYQIDNILPGTPNVPQEDRSGWWAQPDNRWETFISLEQIVAGRAPGRTSDEQITGFVNNTGLGLQFAALGTVLLKKASEQGIGHNLPAEWFSENVHP